MKNNKTKHTPKQGLSAILIALFLVVFAYSGKAQRTVIIQDIDDLTELGGLNLEIKNINGVILNQYLTTENGEVKVLEKGTLLIYAFGKGYDSKTDTLHENVKTKIFKIKRLSININPVVVTGEYGKSEQNNSVNNIRVIDAKRAIKLGAQNLGQLLQNEVNIRLNNDNVLGTSIIMQGLGGQNIKILVDGVPMIGRLNGNIDISQINLNDVERIEIIEGPMSVTFGTDALGGVINIITKKRIGKTYSGGLTLFTDN